MPASDIRIYDNQLVRSEMIEGIPIRSDVLWTNEKGEEKPSVRKRTTKMVQKLSAPLQKILIQGETVLYAMPARSPLSVVEQLTAAWWTALLAACAVVVTNKRILVFLVKRDGSWRESVRAVYWGDIQEIEAKGMLVANATFKFRNGNKVRYTYFRRGDAKKFNAIAAALIPSASGEQTAAHGFVPICPDCCGVLTEGQYSCSGCGLVFKNEKTMIQRSIFLPGGGYFYTGHPLIAILPAIIEGILVLDILVALAAVFASPKRMPEVFAGLVVLAIFWALETAITILHCRRYIREFIPEKRNSVQVPLATK